MSGVVVIGLGMEIAGAIDAAHKNPNVLAMWNKFFALCECVPLKTVTEAEEMFAGFEPIAD